MEQTTGNNNSGAGHFDIIQFLFGKPSSVHQLVEEVQAAKKQFQQRYGSCVEKKEPEPKPVGKADERGIILLPVGKYPSYMTLIR